MVEDAVVQAAATRKTSALLSLTLLALLAGGAVALTVPSLRALVPPCPVRELTGLYCPGCGSARVLAALLNADVATALSMNALIVFLLPTLAFVLVGDSLWLAGVRWLPRARLNPVAVRVLVGAILAFWVLRNLPLAPFSWLAPG